jgi:hypothetical protein
VLATVHRDADKWTPEEAEAFKAPIRQKYEDEGNPYYATARLWDDGVIDPAQTRDVLGTGAGGGLLEAPVANRWSRQRGRGNRLLWGVPDVMAVRADGHGNLHDAGDADAKPSGACWPRRARLLQPQHRHLARTLWRCHHHPHLCEDRLKRWTMCAMPGSTLLRRHRRHG